MLTVYGYRKCSTCRKATAFLDEAGREYKYVDITTDPPSRATLAKVIAGDDYEIKHLFNTSGKAYREGGYTALRKTLSEDEQLDALAANGRLIKRPIVTDGKRFTVGFKQEPFAAVWG